jgi:flavin reductase (DIM6/NTAB) family NADH-FMN oxidoreductase RutF
MVSEKSYKLLYPMRVCLISASHEGKDNFMPAAWVYPVSAEPALYAVAISKKRFTYNLIGKSGYFVINVPGAKLKDKLEKFGRTSGKDWDKFRLWGLTKEKCEKIPCVSITEALMSMEMKVSIEYEIGDHVLFIGELLHVKERKKAKGIYQSSDGIYLIL